MYCNSKRLKMTEISIKRRLLNRLRYIHKMEYFVIVKHNKIDLFVLIRKLSKIFCYREKSKVYLHIYSYVCVFPFVFLWTPVSILQWCRKVLERKTGEPEVGEIVFIYIFALFEFFTACEVLHFQLKQLYLKSQWLWNYVY